jgi:hypothetical protein
MAGVDHRLAPPERHPGDMPALRHGKLALTHSPDGAPAQCKAETWSRYLVIYRNKGL